MVFHKASCLSFSFFGMPFFVVAKFRKKIYVSKPISLSFLNFGFPQPSAANLSPEHDCVNSGYPKMSILIMDHICFVVLKIYLDFLLYTFFYIRNKFSGFSLDFS